MSTAHKPPASSPPLHPHLHRLVNTHPRRTKRLFLSAFSFLFSRPFSFFILSPPRDADWQPKVVAPVASVSPTPHPRTFGPELSWTNTRTSPPLCIFFVVACNREAPDTRRAQPGSCTKQTYLFKQQPTTNTQDGGRACPRSWCVGTFFYLFI